MVMKRGSMINFNLDGISDIANNCIDKIASATGYLCNRETPKRIAINTYIDEIQKSNLPADTKAVLIYNSKKNIKEWSNQKTIIDKALPLISGKAKPEAVEDDWLLSFFDKARLVSDEEFQSIWARILAGEFEKPGSFSIRTLERLKGLSKNEAEVFSKVGRYALNCNGNCFVYFDKRITDKYFFFDEILRLEECGLIKAQQLSYNLYSPEDGSECVGIYNSKLICFIQKANDFSRTSGIIVPCFAFTNSGKELLNAINVGIDEDLFLEFVLYLSLQYRSLFSISLHRIIDFKEDGKIEYDDNNLLSKERTIL